MSKGSKLSAVLLALMLLSALIYIGCSDDEEPLQPPKSGKVVIESTPEGAAIWLDGENTDEVTPDTIEFSDTDSHTVVLVLEGYEDYTAMFAATLGETKTVSATLVEVAVAKLAVKSTPSGASIFLDGTDTGEETPDTLEFDVSGSHEVVLKLAGYDDYTANVDVVLGEVATVDATLSAVQLTITFSIYGNGSVSREPDKATYSFGEKVVYTAEPDPGWYFDGYTVDPDEGVEDLIDSVTLYEDFHTSAYFGQLFTVTGTIENENAQDLVSPYALIDTSQSQQIVILESLGWQADAQTGEFRIDYIISERDELTGGIITGWDDVDQDLSVEAGEPLGYWDFTADGSWDNLDRVDLIAGDSIGGAQVILYLEPAASSGKAKSIPETSVRIK